MLNWVPKREKTASEARQTDLRSIKVKRRKNGKGRQKECGDKGTGEGKKKFKKYKRRKLTGLQKSQGTGEGAVWKQPLIPQKKTRTKNVRR